MEATMPGEGANGAAALAAYRQRQHMAAARRKHLRPSPLCGTFNAAGCNYCFANSVVQALAAIPELKALTDGVGLPLLSFLRSAAQDVVWELRAVLALLHSQDPRRPASLKYLIAKLHVYRPNEGFRHGKEHCPLAVIEVILEALQEAGANVPSVVCARGEGWARCSRGCSVYCRTSRRVVPVVPERVEGLEGALRAGVPAEIGEQCPDCGLGVLETPAELQALGSVIAVRFPFKDVTSNEITMEDLRRLATPVFLPAEVGASSVMPQCLNGYDETAGSSTPPTPTASGSPSSGHASSDGGSAGGSHAADCSSAGASAEHQQVAGGSGAGADSAASSTPSDDEAKWCLAVVICAWSNHFVAFGKRDGAWHLFNDEEVDMLVGGYDSVLALICTLQLRPVAAMWVSGAPAERRQRPGFDAAAQLVWPPGAPPASLWALSEDEVAQLNEEAMMEWAKRLSMEEEARRQEEEVRRQVAERLVKAEFDFNEAPGRVVVRIVEVGRSISDSGSGDGSGSGETEAKRSSDGGSNECDAPATPPKVSPLRRLLSRMSSGSSRSLSRSSSGGSSGDGGGANSRSTSFICRLTRSSSGGSKSSSGDDEVCAAAAPTPKLATALSGCCGPLPTIEEGGASGRQTPEPVMAGADCSQQAGGRKGLFKKLLSKCSSLKNSCSRKQEGEGEKKAKKEKKEKKEEKEKKEQVEGEEVGGQVKMGCGWPFF